jgi:hypothetical protein
MVYYAGFMDVGPRVGLSALVVHEKSGTGPNGVQHIADDFLIGNAEASLHDDKRRVVVAGLLEVMLYETLCKADRKYTISGKYSS